MNKSLATRLYYSISEVADLTDLPPYTLRAWEKEFSCLRPKRVHGKNRAYRERDIGIVLLIKQLLCQERYTIQGVKQRFKSDPQLLRQTNYQAALFFEQRRAKMHTPSPRSDSRTDPEIEMNHITGKAISEDSKDAPKISLAEAIEGIKKELLAIHRLL